MEHHYQQAHGIRLHYVEQGSGPLVLMLHGFPDFWYSWRHQIPVVAGAGYRVIAVDLRGYNLSERPVGIAKYKLDVLAADIAALVHTLDAGPPTVVGHDWGGIIAWHLAMHHRQCVRSLVILNAPHPLAFARELKKLSSQWLRSWYAGLFQLPKLPEAFLSAREDAVFKRVLRSGPAETDAELEEYLSAFAAPGALSAALNYYRAALRYRSASPKTVHIPTLVLWGKRDPFLVPRLSEGLQAWVPECEVAVLPDAGHWLHLTHAEQVNGQMLAMLRRSRV